MADEKKDFKQKVGTWMSGRNGWDELTVFVLSIAIILMLVNVFVRTFILSIISLVLMVYVCWRILSRNAEEREVENSVFLDFVSPIIPWFRHPAAAAKEVRTYTHLSCPECGQRVRVPRKKGKIRITCPKCQAKFEAKS